MTAKTDREIISQIVELTAPRTVQFKTESLNPIQLESDQFIGRTVYSSISPGTELAAYTGAPPLRPMKVYPRLMGYCNVAEVIAKGPNVSSLKVGDKVLTTQSHRSSFVCREKDILLKLPEEINLEHASTTYLFHLGYNALLRGGLKAGMKVGIVGLGTLGIATAAVAHALGASVFAFSDQPASLELAHQLASAKAFSKNHGEASELNLDLIVLTSNLWADWKLSVSLPRYGGTVSVLGFPGRTEKVPEGYNPLEARFFYDRQLTLIAAGLTPDIQELQKNCQLLLGLISEKRLPAEQFLSIRAPWSEIDDVYRRLEKREAGMLTAILDWGN